MASSTQLSIRTALHTALEARGGLSGVDVNRYPMDATEATTRHDFIWLGDDEQTQTHETMGGARMEANTLTGGVWCQREGNGASKALDAHTAAIALFKEVEDELREDPTITGSCRHSQLTSSSTRHEATDRSRVCIIEFTIETESRI